jgi:hypothetical protein
LKARIAVPKALWADLQVSLGRSIKRRADSDRRKLRREQGIDVVYNLIDYYRGMRMEIFADEHPPPHFHIKTQLGDASFRITDCKRIAGKLPVSTRTLKKWWLQNRKRLVRVWNEMRPTDCPVGAMAMPAGW